MDEFIHVKTIIGIILGLGLTHLIRESVVFIQHPGRNKIYWVHFLWVLYVFLLMVHFWWWELALRDLEVWFFLDYLFLIFYVLLYYILCALLFPSDLKGYSGFKEYFYSRKVWFFGILALAFLADIIDTYIKGPNYYLAINSDYYIRLVSHVVLCIVAIFVNNKLFHKLLILSFLIYEIVYITRFFNVGV